MTILKILIGLLMTAGLVTVAVLTFALLVNHMPARARKSIRSLFSATGLRFSGAKLGNINDFGTWMLKFLVFLIAAAGLVIVLAPISRGAVASFVYFWGGKAEAREQRDVVVPVGLPMATQRSTPTAPEPGTNWREDYVMVLGKQISSLIDCEILPPKVTVAYNPAKDGRLMPIPFNLALKNTANMAPMIRGSHVTTSVSPGSPELIWKPSVASGLTWDLKNEWSWEMDGAAEDVVRVGWRGKELVDCLFTVTMEHVTLKERSVGVRMCYDSGVCVLHLMIRDVARNTIVSLGSIPTSYQDRERVECDVDIALTRADGRDLEGNGLIVGWDGVMVDAIGPHYRTSTLSHLDPELLIAHAYEGSVCAHIAIRPR